MIAPTSSKTLDEYNKTLRVAQQDVLHALILTDAFNWGGGHQCSTQKRGAMIDPSNIYQSKN